MPRAPDELSFSWSTPLNPDVHYLCYHSSFTQEKWLIGCGINLTLSILLTNTYLAITSSNQILTIPSPFHPTGYTNALKIIASIILFICKSLSRQKSYF